MDKFEEYKLFVEDTAKFSDRRQMVSNIYVTVNSIILTAIAFLVKDANIESLWKSFVIILILSAGIVICLQWYRLIIKYKRLINFRITQLREIENAIEGCHRMYHKEDELYPCDEKGKIIKGEGLNFSDRERWLPTVFAVIYGIFLIGLVVIKFCFGK